MCSLYLGYLSIAIADQYPLYRYLDVIRFLKNRNTVLGKNTKELKNRQGQDQRLLIPKATYFQRGKKNPLEN
jgi:hypothetical protein